jgi:hypothetical protein
MDNLKQLIWKMFMTDEGEYSSSIPSTLFLNQKAQIGLIEKFKLN